MVQTPSEWLQGVGGNAASTSESNDITIRTLELETGLVIELGFSISIVAMLNIVYLLHSFPPMRLT